MSFIQIRETPQKIDGPFQIWNDYKCILIDFKDEINKQSFLSSIYYRTIEIKNIKFISKNFLEFTIKHTNPINEDDVIEFYYGTNPSELESDNQKYHPCVFPYYYPRFILRITENLPSMFFFKVGYKKLNKSRGCSPPYGTLTFYSDNYNMIVAR